MRLRFTRFPMLSIGLVALAMPAIASANTFSLLRVAGVPGTSQIQNYTDWIEILDYAASAGVLGVTADFRPVEVTKQTDASDPTFFEHLGKQTTLLDGCALSYGFDGNGQVRKVSAIGLDGVTVTNLTPSTASGTALQSLSFDYKQISIITYQYDSNGTATGQKAFCWDTTTNKDCGTKLLGCPANN